MVENQGSLGKNNCMVENQGGRSQKLYPSQTIRCISNVYLNKGPSPNIMVLSLVSFFQEVFRRLPYFNTHPYN